MISTLSLTSFLCLFTSSVQEANALPRITSAVSGISGEGIVSEGSGDGPGLFSCWEDVLGAMAQVIL